LPSEPARCGPTTWSCAEVVIGEFDYRGDAATSGEPFKVANVIVLRVRDEQIVASRDYHDHRALADAAGRLPEFVTAVLSDGAAG
jgi:uncharacterized protein